MQTYSNFVLYSRIRLNALFPLERFTSFYFIIVNSTVNIEHFIEQRFNFQYNREELVMRGGGLNHCINVDYKIENNSKISY